MRRKSTFLMVFLIILVVSSFTAFEVPSAEASGTIYIRANGLVEGTDKITTADNVTYTFTDYINDSVVVERSNILIDGARFSLYVVSKSECGLNLTSVTNVTIINIDFIHNFGYGIWLSSSSNNNISGNTIGGNDFGIVLEYSSNNTICGNLILSGGYYGIRLYSSSNNSILGNNIVGLHENGISLSVSSNNGVSGNNIIGSWDGILLSYSSNNNSISGNNITNNFHSGISLASFSNNSIYHNNFNNTQQVSSDGTSTNVWDDGYPSGGNYWSDYNGTDADHDGIGDEEYSIDTNNTDNYPLMGMFNSYNVTYYTPPITPHVCNVTVISNSTISDFVAPIWIEHPEVIFLKFNVTGTEGSTGFCRVSFSTALMNGTYHVSLNGTEIPYTLLPCSDVNTSYLYFNYTHSTQEVIIIPEFPSLLILPLFFMSTLLAAIVCGRKRR